jgi:hypothetical protein
MLLLLDFLREAAEALLMSAVTFSLSPLFLVGTVPPMDLRARRVAGSVASPCDAMLEQLTYSHALDVFVKDTEISVEIVVPLARRFGDTMGTLTAAPEPSPGLLAVI